MYPCFECPPAIQWFRIVVNCKLCFTARTTRYVVLSEVKCLQAQFFVLEGWCTAAICKHKDSRSLATREFCKMWRYLNKVSAPPREKSSKYKQEQQKCAFLPLWQQNRLWCKTWMKVWSKLKVWLKSKCANQMFNSEHLTCKVRLSFKSV